MVHRGTAASLQTIPSFFLFADTLEENCIANSGVNDKHHIFITDGKKA
jgi:hypothetical protein